MLQRLLSSPPPIIFTVSNNHRFFEKICVVTGGASGIGESVASLFASEGATSIVLDVNLDKGMSICDEIKARVGKSVFWKVDVTSFASVVAAATQIEEKYGQVDVLVNSAGVLQEGSVFDTSEAAFSQLLDVNLISAFRTIKAFSPMLVRSAQKSHTAAIVNISSIQWARGFQNSAAYAASKGGLNSLTRQVSRDLARFRVRCNTVSPGVIRTPIFPAERNFRDVISYTPLSRIGIPSDVAYACAYLASHESAFVTGIDLVVDGGFINRPI
jgi:cyclopentanol dehydrogenase